MGNTFNNMMQIFIENVPCSDEDAHHLISVGRSICPFSQYNINPMFLNSLGVNSSQHLSDHYTAVQSSLTPQQLDSFTHALRSTVGHQGIVNMGGMGVVALSLAVLISSLARQVRGQFEPESGPLQGWFVKEEGGSYHPQVSLISDYLRLVPHIANNPARMKEETHKAFKKLFNLRGKTDGPSPIRDVRVANSVLIFLIEYHLYAYLAVINDVPSEDSMKSLDPKYDGKYPKVPEAKFDNLQFSFNCDTKVAEKILLEQIEKSEETEKALKRCSTTPASEGNRMEYIGHVALLKFYSKSILNSFFRGDDLTPVFESFDLKAKALGKWTV